MLQRLYVKNLALIEEIEVEFRDGLNILTGETGAGKSIILGSINLALGARYSKDLLRKGAEYGFVELGFQVENERQLLRLKELDIYPEEGSVVLSRRLMEGRSVSRINGETVTMALLKKVAEILIDIHGQHEHQSLLYKKNHLSIVDAFAKEDLGNLKKEMEETYREYRKWKKELEDADLDEASRAKELSFLQFETKEIEDAELKEGEDEELERAYRFMLNSKKIADGVSEAYAFTSEEDANASESLSRAIRALGDVKDYDEAVAGLYEQLSEIDSLLNDFNRDLSDYRASCECSEEELYETENRLNEINHLKLKYGNQISDILAYYEEQIKKIQKLEDYEAYIQSLNTNCAKAKIKMEETAEKLTKIRKKQAKLLEKSIGDSLKELNFADVKFEISILPTEHCSPDGMDEVEFMISMNPGQPVRPLANVASGGELSRIMLAIKTVLADKDDTETLIFDEIDVGISGRTAQKVSEKMALIGREHQVICITHLAQIAAMADHHYMISKTVGNMDTTTGIRKLNDVESIEELARILGGAKITDAVLQNAKEMKDLACQVKEKERS
ncbi:MAG: DNA repair protein RecN [Lachnospiraceae bacterium]|nr:DNA repair protein RecN [Lachnospiraceae bacterium]